LDRCYLPVDLDSLYLPILWNSEGIVYPTEEIQGNWVIEVSSGTKFRASCTTNPQDEDKSRNHFTFPAVSELESAEVQCISGSLVNVKILGTNEYKLPF